jgi:hypothetical protein
MAALQTTALQAAQSSVRIPDSRFPIPDNDASMAAAPKRITRDRCWN